MSDFYVNNIFPTSGTDVTVDGNLVVTGTNNIRPYKVYSALLNQTGTNAPTAIELVNELGIIGFSYISQGQYDIISDSKFVEGKTSIDGNNVKVSNQEFIGYGLNSINNCRIVTRDSLGNAIDDVLDYNFVEIRVYP